MFGFFNVVIYIKRRRKPPPARGQNEAVVFADDRLDFR